MPIERRPEFSDDAWSLIKGLLVRDPSQRMGGRNGAIDIISHPFFSDIDWIKLINR